LRDYYVIIVLWCAYYEMVMLLLCYY